MNREKFNTEFFPCLFLDKRRNVKDWIDIFFLAVFYKLKDVRQAILRQRDIFFSYNAYTIIS